MVKGSKAGLFVPHDCWQAQNFNCMSTSLEPSQPGLPARVNPDTYTIPEDMTMPRFGIPSIPNLMTQQNVAQRLPRSSFEGLPQSSIPPFQNLLLAKSPYWRRNISAFSRAYGQAAVPNAIHGCQRFVIFDHSGGETRLIHSSLPSGLKLTPALTKPTDGSYLNYKEHADKTNQINRKSAKFHEVPDENLSSGEESEMHEDTEELNALLCSDNDYDDDSNDVDVDDDEVTSTGHSPSTINYYEGIQGQTGEISEEGADSAGPNKRQKLFDGGFTRSSVADIVSSKRITGVHTCDEDTEPCYATGQNQETDTICILDNKKLKEDTILRTLEVLEGIIPGAKGKDPLLVIDIAIDYLKSLKPRGKTSGVNYS